MKTLKLHQELGVNVNLVDTEFLKGCLPENCNLEIFGFGKTFKSNGHWTTKIDVRLNGKLDSISCTTTNSMALDNYYSDTFSEEDEQAQANAFESLVADILLHSAL